MTKLWIDIDGQGEGRGYIGMEIADDNYTGMWFEIPYGETLRPGVTVLSHGQVDSMVESLEYDKSGYALRVDREDAIEFLVAHCRDNYTIVG